MSKKSKLIQDKRTLTIVGKREMKMSTHGLCGINACGEQSMKTLVETGSTYPLGL